MNDSSQMPSSPSRESASSSFGVSAGDRVRGGTGSRKSGTLGPTMPPRTPLQAAMALDSGRQSDRFNEGQGDEEVYGDDSVLSDNSSGGSGSASPEGGEGGGASMMGEEEGSVLDLPSQSYARRETSDGEEEQKRQQNLLDVRDRFFGKGSSSSDSRDGKASGERGRQSSQGGDAMRQSQQNRGSSGEGGASLSSRFQSQLARSRAQDSKMREKMETAEDIKKSVQKFQKLVSTATKTFSAASSETILPLFWLIFVLNVETLNTLIFRVDLPTRLTDALSLTGLDLSVDRDRRATMGNLILWLTTAFVDIVIILMIVAALMPLFFVISVVMLQAFGIISVLNLVTGG